MTDLDLCPRSFLSLLWYVCNFMLNFGAILKVVAQMYVLSPYIYIYLYISNGHQAFSGTSSLEKKTVCSFHSEYSSAETNSNTQFGYGFGSRQMGQGLFLNSHFSFASNCLFLLS